ncbi:unnamed protein product [Lactuca saligna]|uniref:Uncharacterized protein n=1 Tax=Lactuca saligna TaxID=75948 RepID=A0AA35ZFL4_LACSI|nr:unnamed protein product [Lactuca saligna]
MKEAMNLPRGGTKATRLIHIGKEGEKPTFNRMPRLWSPLSDFLLPKHGCNRIHSHNCTTLWYNCCDCFDIEFGDITFTGSPGYCWKKQQS